MADGLSPVIPAPSNGSDPRSVPYDGACLTMGLSALEAYAVALHEMLGNMELVSGVLAKFVAGSKIQGVTATQAVDSGVTGWCLDAAVLQQHDPAALARVLLLRHGVTPAVAGNLAAQQQILHALPDLLGGVPAPLAVQLASVAVAALPPQDSEGASTMAASWLKMVLDKAGISVFLLVAGTVLEEYPEAASEGWAVADIAMRGPDPNERRLCAQQLLPALVKACDKQLATQKIESYIEALLSSSSRANVVDALSLAVTFHDLMLVEWKLATVDGGHESLGLRLIAAGLRMGLKEAGAGRKHGKFLLQAAVHLALTDSTVQAWIREHGSSPEGVEEAWRHYWALYDSMEDYSSHLVKASWDAVMEKLVAFLEATKQARSNDGRHPCFLFSPQWLEALLIRALVHDNHSVHKFILGQLLTLDQTTAGLSEAFVLGELLPRFSHGVEGLYPKADVRRSAEQRTMAFFRGFILNHPEGPGAGMKRLLEATIAMPALHHTPLRLILSAASAVDAPGAFNPAEAASMITPFFQRNLGQVPLSMRLLLARRMLQVVPRVISPEQVGNESQQAGAVAALSAAVAEVPDGLLLDLRPDIASTAVAVLGSSAEALARSFDFARGLVSPRPETCEGTPAAEAAGQAYSPLGAVRCMLGVVRIVWAIVVDLAAEQGGEATLSFWQVLLPTLQDIDQRLYLPRRAVCSSLFAVAYAKELLPTWPQLLSAHPQVCGSVLNYVEMRASAALAEASSEAEAPWLWLFALVLEKLWDPRCAPAMQVLNSAAAALRRWHASPVDTQGAALVAVAAISYVAAAAPMLAAPEEQLDYFLDLWRAAWHRPTSVTDQRYGIQGADGHGEWLRVRTHEYEDLQRMDREGLGRVTEWRHASSIFLVAKWRAMAKICQNAQFVEVMQAALQPQTSQQSDPAAGSKAATTLKQVVLGLIDELDAMQSPHVGHWAVVVRRLVYPLCFGQGSCNATSSPLSEDEQREALKVLCSGLSGLMTASTGDSPMTLPRSAQAELAAALCDSRLLKAEVHLFPAEDRPVAKALRKLLALGETVVSLSRTVAVPVLAALLTDHKQGALATEELADFVATMLLHSEASIIDGSFTRTLDMTANALDSAGPASGRGLEETSSSSKGLMQKFGQTPCLVRILCLAGLDAVTERSLATDGQVPPITRLALEKLLAQLRHLLDEILNPPNGKGKSSNSRPPTPMPWSNPHRMQLRGWQAIFVLSVHATAAIASFLVPELFHTFRTPHVPDVRDYQELAGCLLASRFEEMVVEPYLVVALREFDTYPQVSSSLLMVAAYLCRRWALRMQEGQAPPPHAQALVRAIAPYLSHNSAYVRGIAAWAFYYFVQATSKYAQVVGSTQDALLGPDALVIAELYSFLCLQKEHEKMRNRMHPIFASFEPFTTSALLQLTERSAVHPTAHHATHCSDEEVEDESSLLHVFEYGDFKPTAPFMEEFKAEVCAEVEYLWDRDDPTLFPSSSEQWLTHIASFSAVEAQPEVNVEASAVQGVSQQDANDARRDASGPQRKFIPSQPPVAPALEATVQRRARSPLIVIATLVDKMPNLAGLCRTCEIFNCEALCLPNARVVQDQAFKSMSVTAEKWLPIKEVPRASVRAYLLMLRQRGYELIGVEQTHSSVLLNEYKFAASGTALVLGAEKEGIDSELLPLLDACVEIPQAGQIRSLNVHVSGSLAIWEYTKQRLSRS